MYKKTLIVGCVICFVLGFFVVYIGQTPLNPDVSFSESLSFDPHPAGITSIIITISNAIVFFISLLLSLISGIIIHPPSVIKPGNTVTKSRAKRVSHPFRKKETPVHISCTGDSYRTFCLLIRSMNRVPRTRIPKRWRHSCSLPCRRSSLRPTR